MKSAFLVLLTLSISAVPSWAADAVANGGGVVIGGNAPAAVSSETCVEVEIGGEKAPKLDCINQELKQQVDRVQPVGNLAPLDASSPSVKLHGFNETALQQQYGKNLGKSVVPFRPAKP